MTDNRDAYGQGAPGEPSDEEIMARVRAARVWNDMGRPTPDEMRYGFLTIFHPRMTHQQKLAFNRACRDTETDQ